MTQTLLPQVCCSNLVDKRISFNGLVRTTYNAIQYTTANSHSLQKPNQFLQSSATPTRMSVLVMRPPTVHIRTSRMERIKVKVWFPPYIVYLNARDHYANFKSHFPGDCQFAPRTEVDTGYGMSRILYELRVEY